jgi:hypothetical protein
MVTDIQQKDALNKFLISLSNWDISSSRFVGETVKEESRLNAEYNKRASSFTLGDCF